MKTRFISRVATLLLCAAVVAPSIPVLAASDYLVDIGFDDVISNDQSEYIAVEGSSSARVVEDGTGNKSYTVECGNVDNNVKMILPEYTTGKKYAIQFDIRMEGEPAEGKINFTNTAGMSEDLITIDELGNLRAAEDGRIVAFINGQRMVTVTVMFDTELKLLSMGNNGKIQYYRQDMGIALSNISEVTVSTYANKAETSLYIDNVRVYNGDKYINKKTNTPYNPESIEYVPEDEKGLADKIYYKNKLDSSSSMSMTRLPKRNKIEWLEEPDNGYAKLTKLTSDDAMIDMTIGQTTKRVVLECSVRFDKSMPETLFYIRDNTAGAQINVAPITMKGDSVIAQGSSKQLRKNTWYKISMALDLAKHTYAAYVDGELIGENKSINTDFNNISVWRIYVGGTDLGSIDIDNLALYGGNEPRDIENATVTAKSRYSDTAALNFLRGKKAIQLYSSTAFLGGEKKKLDKPVIIKNDTGLVDEATFENFFGVSAELSGESITVGSNVKMGIGSTNISVGGKSYNLNAAPEVVDGVLYLPASDYAKAAQVNGFVDDGHGMIAIGSNVDAADARLKQANIYMYFDRKPVEDLKAQFLANTDNGTKHPRLIADKSDFDRLKNEVKTDPIKADWYDKVIKTADGILDSAMVEYKINNGRLLDVSNSALSRMEYLGFAYQMTGDAKYAQRGIKELEAICAFPDWHPDHYLDTGTMASAVAIGFDWMYDYMTEEQRTSIAKAAHKHGLESAKAGYYASATYNDFWVDTETNWGIICNGGISNLALATAEYDIDESMEILRNALRSIEIPWYRIAPDGAWYEGTGYWSYLLTHLSLFMSGYESVMAESFGEKYMGMDKYAYFQAYFQGPEGMPNNFHDADDLYAENPGQFYLADVYDDESLMLYRIDQMKKFNITPSLFDIIWCKAGLDTSKSSINLDNDKYFRETEFVSMRENWNRDDSAWLSFHGGYSNTAHDHIDVGTFVYNIGNVRWAIDLGKDMLSYSTFNPAVAEGYDPKLYYRRKGEGHNVVVINPDDSFEMDLSAFAQVNKPVSGTTGSYSSIDLSTAYNVNANKYTRGYLLTDNRRTLTVRDEITLKGDSKLHWFMHTKGQIQIVDNNTALIYQDGKTLKMQFTTNAKSAELKAMAAENLPTAPKFQNTPNKGVSKINYELQSKGDVTITVKMSLVGEPGSNTGVDDIAISEWDSLINKSAETPTYSYGTARLSGIYANGELVKGFTPDVFNYGVSRDESGNAPKITIGESDNADIQTYQRFDDTTIYLIRLTDANGIVTTYTVEVQPFDDRNINIYNSYKLTAIDVSSEQIEEGINNIKEHSCDNDTSTRWSANGANEWCVYDLGETKTIDAFAVAFWKGAERQFNFEIAVSEDGRNYKKVLAQTTEGSTEDAVVYIPEGTVKARYIKFIGHGSNTNEWNNVLEFMALQRK